MTGWERAHEFVQSSRARWLVVAAFSTALAALCFATTREEIIVNDGEIYWEMARSFWERGDFEVPNDLDVINSPELWINHTVLRHGKLYAKYPPLFSVLAALPYRALGLRGLYALNAVSLCATTLAYYALASRLMRPMRAFVSALGLPIFAALLSYAMWEMPHMLSAALLIAGLVCWDSSVRAEGRPALWWALAGGLAFGLCMGVRVQNLFPVVAALGLAWRRARSRYRTTIGLLAPVAGCAAAMTVANHQRFGQLTPFSYGPPNFIGSPVYAETSAHLLEPHFLLTFAWLGCGAALAFRRSLLRRRTGHILVALLTVVALATPPIRTTLLQMAGTVTSLTLNATVCGTGWFDPELTAGYVEKALLGCTPLLVIGLLTLPRHFARAKEPALQAITWIILVTFLFMATRDPDPRSERGAMGAFSFTPRYLFDLMPLLYLLTWEGSQSLRIRTWQVATGAAFGLACLAYFVLVGPQDTLQSKQAVILCLPVGLAAALALAYLWNELEENAVCAQLALGLTFCLCLFYGAASTIGEDCMALRHLAAGTNRWQLAVDAVLPARAVVVGYSHARDSVYYTRKNKHVTLVDASADGGERLLETLRAFRKRGIAIYYFGYGLDKYEQLASEYWYVMVTSDPMMWRLDPKSTVQEVD